MHEGEYEAKQTQCFSAGVCPLAPERYATLRDRVAELETLGDMRCFFKNVIGRG
jgi:hypothetical protein